MDPDLAAVVTAFAALAMIGYLAAVFGLVSSPVVGFVIGAVGYGHQNLQLQ